MDNSKKVPPLLITGCVRPNTGQKALIIKDPEERKEQYYSSIFYYINSTQVNNIVFCDSSNYYNENDFQIFYKNARSLNKNFEWLHFHCNEEKILMHGKEYGEGEIVQYSLKNSKIISHNRWFAKITGRLIITNIDDIFEHINNNHNYFLGNIYAAREMDTRFYIINIEFYKKYFSNLHEKAGKLGLEQLFFNAIRNERLKITTIPRFPYFKGKSGGNGKNYSNESKIKLSLYNVLCVLNIFNAVWLLVSEAKYKIGSSKRLFLERLNKGGKNEIN